MKQLALRDGLALAYAEHGAGPPLLLLHGFTGSSRAWRTEVIDALAAEHRVLVPDLIGHGASARVRDPARFALSEVVADLCELLAARGAERASWIGYSMGGRIALGAAVLEPRRVTALVLEGASPGLADATERAARRAADAELAAALERDGIAPFVEHWMRQPLFATQARRLSPACLAAQRALRLANDPRALAACLRGLGTGTQPPFWKELASIRIPVLLLAGADDTKFCALGERMAQALPDARMHRIADAGHTASLEQPARYLAAVQAFLADAAPHA